MSTFPFHDLRLSDSSGVAEAFAAVDDSGVAVTVCMLTEEAAGNDQWRAAFAHAVQAQSHVPGMTALHLADPSGWRPWAASYQVDGQVGAERLLQSLAAPGASAVPVAVLPALPNAQWPGPASGPAPGPPSRPVMPPPSPRRSSAGVAVAVGAAALVVVAVAAVIVYFSVREEPSAAPPAGTLPATATSTASSTLEAPTTLPRPTIITPSSQRPSGKKPKLRQRKPVRVIGPVWSADSRTTTQATEGWPFAFRVASGWACRPFIHSAVPDAEAVRCTPPGGEARVDVILQPCPDGCGPGERKRLNRQWLDEPDKAKRHGSRTYYVETKRDGSDSYQVDLSHFARGEWQVGVFVLSASREYDDDVLRSMNDVVTQAA